MPWDKDEATDDDDCFGTAKVKFDGRKKKSIPAISRALITSTILLAGSTQTAAKDR